jgi:hypothetical protein
MPRAGSDHPPSDAALQQALLANVVLPQGSSRSMPEAGNTDNFLTLINAVDDSIRPQDQLANQAIVELRDNFSRKREYCQSLRSFNQGQTDPSLRLPDDSGAM